MRLRQVLVAALMLVGCGPAVRFELQQSVEPLVFDSPVGWELVKNRRYLKNRLVVFEASDDCCFVRIEAVPEGKRARSLPLDLVSETLTLSRGRRQGIRVELLGSQEILVANRRGVATTYRMRHGPHSRFGTSVHFRASEYLVVLTLQGVDPLSLEVLDQWSLFLDSVDAPQWEAQDEPLFEPEIIPAIDIYLSD